MDLHKTHFVLALPTFLLADTLWHACRHAAFKPGFLWSCKANGQAI